MTIEQLGWGKFFAEHAAKLNVDGCIPARVAIQHRSHYVLYSELGELRGEVTGKLFYMASGPNELPAVGDWVMVRARPEEQAATIVELLPRKTWFSRRAAGTKDEEQIIASNVDIVFVVTGLDGNFNLRRVERYLVIALERGTRPVLLLNKADLCANIAECESAVKSIAGDAPVHVMSAINNEGIAELRAYLGEGVTGALLGSSGVGKSTIINHLLGEERFETQEVRPTDDHGRHTTTRRELVLLPGGGLLIDTPGMRELQLWGGVEGLEAAFDDIGALAERCRFRDCTHRHEPGCAVQDAIDNGELDEARFQSYLKLQREVAYQKRKSNLAAQLKEKERWKKITSDFRKRSKKGPKWQ